MKQLDEATYCTSSLHALRLKPLDRLTDEKRIHETAQNTTIGHTHSRAPPIRIYRTVAALISYQYSRVATWNCELIMISYRNTPHKCHMTTLTRILRIALASQQAHLGEASYNIVT